jgi:hypothetical protein
MRVGLAQEIRRISRDTDYLKTCRRIDDHRRLGASDRKPAVQVRAALFPLGSPRWPAPARTPPD